MRENTFYCIGEMQMHMPEMGTYNETSYPVCLPVCSRVLIENFRDGLGPQNIANPKNMYISSYETGNI